MEVCQELRCGEQQHDHAGRHQFKRDGKLPDRWRGYFGKNGKAVARHALETTGKPVKIIAEPDNTNWQADGMDLQHIRLTAVDSKGRRCLSYDDELTFNIDGDATIVAVTNGDITTDEIATQQHIRLWQGQAMVILRSGRQPSKITLKTSPKTFKDFITKLETK